MQLATSKRGERPIKEIDLAKYKGEKLTVRGVYEHGWLYEAEILKHSK
jgi:hypothetical protein